MSSEGLPRVAVQDANILIDRAQAGLLDHLSGLPMAFHASNLVLAEITLPAQRACIKGAVAAGVLAVDTLAADEVGAMAELADTLEGLSIPDCSCILLAKRLGAAILTGDQKLRTATENAGIRVHGVLWLMDQRLRLNVLAPETGAEALLCMHANGARLPRCDSVRRLVAWCGITAEEAEERVRGACSSR